MNESRAKFLLLAAADAMDDGRDPFDHAFLSEHNVTLDECYSLGESLAMAARVMLELSPAVRADALVKVVLHA